ncbi:MAG: hypothetical protein ACK4MT_08165 [Thermaurantiacus tibetensis]|uniref:hypothetical protein n=1 Tax=Thermaurantiacus tibetensis TaxID=2759035 RepID=UPI001890AF4C|nr:hypothetical protein [Thermaurantiacus tibetensis]
MPTAERLLPSAAAIAETLKDAAARVAGESWEVARAEILPHLEALAGIAHATADSLRKGHIGAADARFALECQKLYLANILRHVRVLGRVRGQRLLTSVFAALAPLVARDQRE